MRFWSFVFYKEVVSVLEKPELTVHVWWKQVGILPISCLVRKEELDSNLSFISLATCRSRCRQASGVVPVALRPTRCAQEEANFRTHGACSRTELKVDQIPLFYSFSWLMFLIISTCKLLRCSTVAKSHSRDSCISVASGEITVSVWKVLWD